MRIPPRESQVNLINSPARGTSDSVALGLYKRVQKVISGDEDIDLHTLKLATQNKRNYLPISSNG